MSSSTLIFLAIRVVHVLLAGVWLGAVFFMTVFLSPAIFQSGPAGGQVMSAIVRRGVQPFLASIGGTTILTGLYLFWRFTGGFDPVVSASRAGMAFSIGALAGLIGLILGGSVVGRSAKRADTVAAKLASTPEGPERTALMSEMKTLQARILSFSKIVLVLLLIAMATMALGHYI
jgi:hypothetical protein